MWVGAYGWVEKREAERKKAGGAAARQARAIAARLNAELDCREGDDEGQAK